MTILSIDDLLKRYGRSEVLKGVSLSVDAGERVALLGHNGAGKSTLMKCVLGLITPEGGRIDLAGHEPGSGVARALTAYLPENAAFHPALTGREQIRHYLRLRGQKPQLADELLERVGLGEAKGRRIGTYSKGMRQRVGLAQAMIGAPRLMILDEPTSGLDPVSRREFYALLDDLAAKGTAILLSSHALSELEARTDRVAILSQGQLVADGALSRLRAEAALPDIVHVRARSGQGDALAAALPGGKLNGDRLDLTCAHADKMALLGRIAELGEVVEDVEILPPTLDDFYSHVSRRAA